MKTTRFARGGRSRNAATRAFAAIGAGLLALGAPFAGAIPASAASGTVTQGHITLEAGSPIQRIAVDDAMRTQLFAADPGLGFAYYNGQPDGASGTAVYTVSDDGTLLTDSSPEQSYGGTGTQTDPFWIQTKRTDPGNHSVTRRESYVVGSDFVRTDLSFQNLSASHSNVALNSYADCMLSGSDEGLSEVAENRASCKRTASGPYISVISGEPDATFAAGNYLDVAVLARNYAPLPNGCVPLAACTTAVDNGLAVSFRVAADPGQSVTKTYYSTYSSTLALAALEPRLSASPSTLSAGDSVVFSLDLANHGPSDAPNARLVFQLPQGFTLENSDGNGSYDSATGVWAVGNMSPGATASLRLTARASVSGEFQAGVSSTASDVLSPSPCSTLGGANCGEVRTVTVHQTLDLGRSTLMVDPASVLADQTSFATVTVRLFNTEGGPLTSPGHSVVISSTVGEVGTVTDNGDGSFSARVSSSSVGDGTVSFSVDGSAAATTGELAFVAGVADPANSVSTISGGTRIADGIETHTVTATVRDASGHPVTGRAVDLIASTDDAIGDGAISSFTEKSPGVYEGSVSSTVAGAKKVVVRLGGAEVPATGDSTAVFVAGAADPAHSRFDVSAGEQVVAGEPHLITVTLADVEGNPVGGQADLLIAATAEDLGDGEVASFSQIAAGTYTAAVTSTLAGAKEISVHLDGRSLDRAENSTAHFIAGAVDVNGSGFEVSAGSRAIDVGEHTITVTLVDAFGNAISGGAELLVGTSPQSLGEGEVSDFTEIPESEGTYRATVTSSVAVTAVISVNYSQTSLVPRGNAEANFVGAVSSALPNDAAADTLATTGSGVFAPAVVATAVILTGALALLAAMTVRKRRRRHI